MSEAAQDTTSSTPSEMNEASSPLSSPPSPSPSKEVPKKQLAPFAWGGAATASTAVSSTIPKKSMTLAQIMAEENENRAAAQAAYDMQNMSLAEMEAEQQRLFRSFQQQQQTAATSQEARPASEADLKSPPTDASVSRSPDMDRDFSQRALAEIESCEVEVNNPNNVEEEERRKEGARTATARAPPKLRSSSPAYNQEPDWLAEARNHLSEQEILDIERALQEADANTDESSIALAQAPATPTPAATAPAEDSNTALSKEESKAIETALREADAQQEEESLMMALQIQQQELGQEHQHHQRGRHKPQGNVRSMTRAELDWEAERLHAGVTSRTDAPAMHPFEEQERWTQAGTPGTLLDARPPPRHPLESVENENDDDVVYDESAGFRMNSATPYAWARRDRNTIIGPNNEIRTKHDVQVQGQANAHYLGLEEDDFGLRTHVGNQAFNSFKKNMKRTTKGVATHGTGRAGTDSDAVKGKAMDPHVRFQITKAINSGLIEHCNGAVKQGKEAVVYHAEQGSESHGHDVAVKVFKRITEFRGRGAYVDGDPRYTRQSFGKISEREQLELWAEKEFRNLVRANRSKVPVPTPLHYKENVLFMRFMGNDGWPAPQIREIQMRKGSKKWDILYTQVMEAIRRLYCGARLVHADLSEYNILVAPTFQVDNLIASSEDKDYDLQTVFIDFGQAVDTRHPEAESLLQRDLDRVRSFFVKQEVRTLSIDDALQFVKDEQEESEDEEEVSAEAATANTVEATS